MEIAIEPSKLPQSVPLSLFESIFIGSAENNGESFDVYIGLDKEKALQLKEYSANKDDTTLQKNTSDYERFVAGTYEEWYAKDRTPFAFVHRNSGQLAALAWFGPKALSVKSLKYLSQAERESTNMMESDNWHTVAFRSYAPFRGRGIMTKFMLAVTEIYQHYFPEAKLWISNNRGNDASINLSKKLGYHIDESLSDAETYTMTR